MVNRSYQIQEILNELTNDRFNQNAWLKLYKRLWPRVFSTAYRKLHGRKDLAEDVSQEVFIRLLKYADFSHFAEECDFLSYLYRVVSNTAIEISIKSLQSSGDMEIKGQNAQAEWENKSYIFDSLVNIEAINYIVDNMSSDEKKLVQFMAEGFTHSEIAEAMGLSCTNVGVKVHRVRKKLLEAMKSPDK